MADWKSVKSISDKYGISVERVIAWVRESQITTSVVGSVVLIDDGSVCELVEKEKRLAHLKTNYEQLCAKFEQRIEAELRADEDAGLKMRLLDDFLPVLHRLLCVMIDKLNTEDRKLFNSAFTAAPLYRIAREMGFESVKDYLIAYRKVTRRLPESSDELIKRLQTDLERSRDSFKEMEHTLLRARQNHEDANRMCSDLRDKEIYYIERCERLKEKNRENEKRVERLKKRLLKWEKCPNVGEAGNTGEDESLQELSDEVGNLHIREMELRAQRRELITRVARLEREMYKYNSTENSFKSRLGEKGAWRKIESEFERCARTYFGRDVEVVSRKEAQEIRQLQIKALVDENYAQSGAWKEMMAATEAKFAMSGETMSDAGKLENEEVETGTEPAAKDEVEMIIEGIASLDEMGASLDRYKKETSEMIEKYKANEEKTEGFWNRLRSIFR